MKILAIDIGSTNIKCELFDNNTSIKKVTRQIETSREEGGIVYQYPERIIVHVKRLIRQMTQEGVEIEKIVFSTAMHSVTPVLEMQMDQKMYTWEDCQSTDFVKSFRKTDQAQSFYRKTGTPIHEMSPFAKIGSFKAKPWFKDVKQWVGIKELIMQEFTGKLLVDYSVASATGLFNLETKTWDREILEYLDIRKDQLARLVDTNHFELIRPEVAEDLFVSPNVKVYIGASDGCLASYASYLVNGTYGSLTIGTSGAVRKLSREIELDDEGKTFCYYLNDEFWVVGGASNNGGQVLDWADNIFYGRGELYQKLPEIFNESPVGSHNLIFLPYLFGERAPLWRGDVSAKHVGLNGRHTKYDILRSIIEGMIFNLRLVSEQVELDNREISMNGGLFKNEEFQMLVADIFGYNCLVSSYGEPTFGAAVLAEKVENTRVTNQARIFFNEDNHVAYQKYYDHFKDTVNNEW